ncbi:MAG: PAS domain S-box protein [Plectolyngbya sp. WJT66-NPBG17]|jgi:PAS domain S-box-containing protein|nr:PAS domain S-box protein [Plectolyngbya sp. WJT66-NPBG17]MBW4527954.1 PAS domain S-box protein [Phormidium tanganyikae FI6-MK23]
MTPTTQNDDLSNSLISASSETGIVLQLADGSIAACNSAAQQILGMTIDQLQSASSTSSPWQTIHPDSTPFPGETHPAMLALQSGEPCLNVEMGFYKPDGNLVWIRLDAQPLFQRGEAKPYAVTVTITPLSVPPQTAKPQKIEAKQQSLLAILDASSDFIGYATIDGQAIFVNQAGRELVGLDEAQVTQTAVIDYFLPRDKARVQAEILPVVMREGYWKGDFRFRHFKTGEIVPVDYHLFLLKDLQTGEPTGIATISRNIHTRFELEAERECNASQLTEANVQLEHRNHELSNLNEELEVALEEVQVAEEELSEQNTELRRAQTALGKALQRLTFHVENSPLAVIEWDQNFRVSRWSSEAERIFGWQATEVIGRGFSDWRFVHRDDLERVQLHTAVLADGSEQRVVMHNRNYTKLGKVVHCEWYNSALVDRAGNLVSILSLALDVSDRVRIQTELRESEARYRALAEAIPQLVWVTTPDGQNEYVNQQFCDFAGLSETQLLDLDWLEIIHPDDRDRTRDRWLASVTSGNFYEIEYRFRCFDGTYHWFLGQGVPFRDEQGQVVKWFGTCTDIDSQKQDEAERLQLIDRERKAREAAEQANRIKDEFLAIISHELRTPLNPILGWSRLLQNGKLTPARAAEALNTIERNALQQAQLIDDLLDVSRILRNKLTLTISPVDLVMIVMDAIETVRFAAEAKSIQLQASVVANWGTLLGDSSRLQQVIWNLLSNAVKFTPEGGRVEVRLTQVDSFAQLQVIDTGKGIAPEFLPHLFETFRQEDSSTTRKFGGLGLGLSIAQQLVELHGGSITAESLGVGQGSTFTVRLPISAHSVDRPTPAAVERQNLDLSGVRILVVDDVQDSREFVAFVLEQAGAIVTTAPSAVGALNQLIQVNPDVIVSDVGMPEFNGYELLQRIRRDFPLFQSTPAIALTAYATEDDQRQAIESGFDRHLAKPIDPETLINTLATLVNQPT